MRRMAKENLLEFDGDPQTPVSTLLNPGVAVDVELSHLQGACRSFGEPAQRGQQRRRC